MTANQIAYARLLEDRRHNVISETESARSNRAHERIQEQSNTISAAHYADQRSYWNSSIATQRAQLRSTENINRMRNTLDFLKHQETTALGASSLQETVRANKARESENIRYNDLYFQNASKLASIQAGQLALANRTQTHYESTFIESPVAQSIPFGTLQRVPAAMNNGNMGYANFGTVRVPAQTKVSTAAQVAIADQSNKTRLIEVGEKWGHLALQLASAVLGAKYGAKLIK